MIHRPASSQPRLARRGIWRPRRTLTTLSGLAVFLTAAIGLAPAASAALPPPEPPAPVPPPPLPITVPAHLPLWAIIAIVAATAVLSAATTLITLALEHRHRARRTPAAAPGAPTRPATAEPPTGQGEILSSHQHLAGHGMHRADSR